MWFPLPRCARAAACALLFAAAIAALPVQSAPMPNATRSVSITAREQPVGAFMHELFAAIDVPAVISPNLAGAVNGSFSGPADKVLRDVSRIYNLVPYFDGTAVHIVPAGELARRSFSLAPAVADRLLDEAATLGLPDARNTLRRSGAGSLMAVGTKRFVEQLEDMVRAASPGATGSVGNGGYVGNPGSVAGADFRVFYLRYAWAQDVTMNFGGRQVVLPGVASILRSLVGARPSAPLGQEVQLRPTVPGLRGQGLASQGAAPARPLSSAAVRDAAADALVAALARTAAPGGDAPGQVLLPDAQQARIEADPRLNAIIVRDQADRLPRYEQLIAALDVEPQTLEIEATIIDVNTDRLRELGINWGWNNAGYGLRFGNPAAPAPTAGGVASAVLGSVGQFIARINALQSEGAARVVSSPQVVTLSDVEAVFDNSSTFYVRVAGRENVDLFNVSAGTSLRVTPHVFRDQDRIRIKLMVQVEDGNLSTRQVDQIPVVERSTINTQALIAEGESLLIGGMVRDSTTSGVDKVPGLGDVPVVGNLFKQRREGSQRIERMFLITPRLSGARAATTGAMLQSGMSPTASAAAAAAGVPVAVRNEATAATATPRAPRASVVLDLDAPLPGTALTSANPPPATPRPAATPPRTAPVPNSSAGARAMPAANISAGARAMAAARVARVTAPASGTTRD